MRKKLLLLMMLCLLTAFIVACQNDDDKNENNNNNENDNNAQVDEDRYSSFEDITVDVVAKVNGEEITAEELIENERYLVDYYSMMGLAIDGNEAQIRETALNQLINTKLVLQGAMEDDLVPTDEEVEEEYQSLVEQLTTYHENDNIEEIFEQFDTNEEEVKQDIRTDLTTKKYLEANIKVEEVTEEEIQQAYDDYVKQMESLEQEADELENVKELIKQQIVGQKESEAQQKLIESLRDKSEIEILI